MNDPDLEPPPIPRPRGAEAGWWRTDTAIMLHDSIDRLLDDVELVIDRQEGPVAAEPELIATGVAALDVHHGGVRRGRVTFVEADLPSQADALVCTLARTIELPTLLAVPVVQDATTWIVAGEARVPATLIPRVYVSEQEWRRIAQAIGRLGSRDIWLTEANTIDCVAHLCDLRQTKVLVIRSLKRFGHIDAARDLAGFAYDRGIAILVVNESTPDVPESDLLGIHRLYQFASQLGSKATLISTSSENLLNVSHATVDLLTADLA